MIAGKLETLTRGWRPSMVVLFLLVMTLVSIGVVFIDSAAGGSDDGFPGSWARSQLQKVFLGVVSVAFLLAIDYRRLDTLAPLLYLLTTALLVSLALWKFWAGGIVRWIRVDGFSLQPSELAKVALILLIARVLKDGLEGGEWRLLVKIFAIVAIPFLLIAGQPDLGTALVLLPAPLAMLWCAGMSRKRLLQIGLIALLVVPLLVPFLEDYQLERLTSFFAAGGEELDRVGGYQVRQSMIAIGSGGWTGKGLYLGSHHDLGYLPEDHNDFIFGVIGEEWGLIGTLSVILAFAALCWLLLRIAWRTREPFGRLVVVGITVSLLSQACVNLAMTVGMAPVTGLPLPFISHGGTSLLASLLSVGIVLTIARRQVTTLHPDGLQSGASPVRRPIGFRSKRIPIFPTGN